MAQEAKWYIVQTTPMYENQVMSNILRLKEHSFPDYLVDCKIPIQIVQKPGTNRKGEAIVKEVEEKIYPCYVFVKMIYDDRVVAAIRWMTGVSRWVGIGYVPTALTSSEVISIVGLEPPVESIHAGDKCRITSGPLEGFEATVVSVADTVAALSVDMFGRETEAEVDIDSLELLIEEA